MGFESVVVGHATERQSGLNLMDFPQVQKRKLRKKGSISGGKIEWVSLQPEALMLVHVGSGDFVVYSVETGEKWVSSMSGCNHLQITK